MKESESKKSVGKGGQESPGVALDSKGKEGKGADSKGNDGKGNDVKATDSKGADVKGSDGKGADGKGDNDQKSPEQKPTSPEEVSSPSQQQSPSAQGQPSAEQQQPRQSGSGIDRGTMLKGAAGIAAIIALASIAMFIPGAAALALGLGAGLAMGGALNGGHEAIKRSNRVADEGQSSQGNDGVGNQKTQARSQGQEQGQQQQQGPAQQAPAQQDPAQQGQDKQGNDPTKNSQDSSKDPKADKDGLDIDKLSPEQLKAEIEKQRSGIRESMGINSEYKDQFSVQMDISKNFLGGVGSSGKMFDGPKGNENDYDRGVSFSQSASKILESKKADDDLDGQKEQLKGLLKLKELVGEFKEATNGKVGQDNMSAKVEFLKSDGCKELKELSNKVSPPPERAKDDLELGKSGNAAAIDQASKAKDDSGIGMKSSGKDAMAAAISEVGRSGLVGSLSESTSSRASASASAQARAPARSAGADAGRGLG